MTTAWEGELLLGACVVPPGKPVLSDLDGIDAASGHGGGRQHVRPIVHRGLVLARQKDVADDRCPAGTPRPHAEQPRAVDGVGVSRCFFAPGVSKLSSHIYTGQTRLFVSNSRSLEGFRAYVASACKTLAHKQVVSARRIQVAGRRPRIGKRCARGLLAYIQHPSEPTAGCPSCVLPLRSGLGQDGRRRESGRRRRRRVSRALHARGSRCVL